jgi:Kef-type K+ transport system membrane component KefB
VLVVSPVTTFAGASGGCFAGKPAQESLRLGARMNCRGVRELVVASVGLQYHLINALGFTILVLMALATTTVTGPLVWLLAR